MLIRAYRAACAALFVAIAVAPLPAKAVPITVNDNPAVNGGAGIYYGNNDHGFGDVISGVGDHRFDISNATFTGTGNSLHVVINTNYSGNAGLFGTGYGALFLKSGVGAWTPSGTAANHYITDNYATGTTWTYAFTLQNSLSNSNQTGTLYRVADGTVVKPENIGFGGTFRNGQAVQFTPNAGAASFGTGTWTFGLNTITIDITSIAASLGASFFNDFAFAWAMTCANDVIQGQVDFPPGANGDTPLPAALPMFVAGLGMMGLLARRRRSLASSRSGAPSLTPSRQA